MCDRMILKSLGQKYYTDCFIENRDILLQHKCLILVLDVQGVPDQSFQFKLAIAKKLNISDP